jgi:hypothetical protein
MNVIDNGVSEILKVTRVVTPDELCFRVKVIDYYGKKKTIRVMDKSSISEMKKGKYKWTE